MDHEATWSSYLGENPGWQQTATVLTGPLLIASVVLGTIFSRIVGGYAYFGQYGNFFTALIGGLVMAVVGLFIAVFVFSYLAGVFKGQADFPRAFAAVSLAAIPAWVASAVATLIPFLGFFLALAGGILSLVFMYRILPMALDVPNEKRVVHFVASMVVILVINMIIGGVLGFGSPGDTLQRGDFSSNKSENRSASGSGVLGEMERQGQLMDAARADEFDPPGNGELSGGQVRDYINVLEKSRAMQEEYMAKMQDLSEEMKAKEASGENPSLDDLSKMYQGFGTAMGVNNAEMEIVKSGGGNWAEHQWVKEQLHIAKIQQGDGSDAIAHNYELYEKYREELEGDS